MKTCPVCDATCFDDMEVCYGCMHDFTRDGAPAWQRAEMGAQQGLALQNGDGANGADFDLDKACLPQVQANPHTQASLQAVQSYGGRPDEAGAPQALNDGISGKTLELFPVALRSPSALGSSQPQSTPEAELGAANAAFSMQAPEGYRLVVSLQKVPAVA